MKTLRNLGVIIIYFTVFFLALMIFYFVRIVEPFNYIERGLGNELLKNTISFISNYVFAISVFASVITIFALGSLVKLSGKKSVLISVFIFAALLSLYPCYTYFFSGAKESNSLYMQSKDIVKYLDVRAFTKYDNYSLYATGKADNGEYKGVIAVEDGFYKPLYFADYASLANKYISLKGVKVVSVVEPKIISSTNLNVTSYKDKYAQSLFSGVFSKIILFSYMQNIFDLYTSKTSPIYSVAVIFLALFLFLFGGYLVTASLSSPYHKYHNILTAVFSYYIFFMMSSVIIKIFNIMPSDINEKRFIFISVIIVAVGFFMIIFSVILNKLLKVSSHYEKIKGA